MTTLHVVSHTHWDREWYRTHQEFRFRLVRLVDRLLDLLDSDPEFRYFTLDGQMVILDDYLAIRPGQEPRLRRLIESGRLLVGPWYVLPDEFLEGPEPMIRNLLLGQEACRRFTADRQPMEAIAYLPDSFGHISQIPQVAAGFGMAAACVWRGVGVQPTEFRWASPDGTECLMLHLRESYSNGAWLASDMDGFVHDLAKARDALAPHSPTGHLLIMNGTDHMEPRRDLPARLRAAEEMLGGQVVHSTLPDYLAAVQDTLGPAGISELALVQGEMRSSQRAHLLPAVLSTRMWIKQANGRCENLLTRWAEPAAALAEQVCNGTSYRGFLREAWTWLLQNHPHDSICGCSIDQVHDEMRTRFAWSEQIAEQVTEAGLASLAERIEALQANQSSDDSVRVVVFNSTTRVRTDRVRAHLPSRPSGDWVVLDDAGQAIPFREVEHAGSELYNQRLTRDQFVAFLTQIAASQGSQLGHLTFNRVDTRIEQGVGFLEIEVVPAGAPGQAAIVWADLALRIQSLLADESVADFYLHVVQQTGVEVEFLARNVPAVGYRQYRTCRSVPAPAPSLLQPAGPCAPFSCIENEYFAVEADPLVGALVVTDKSTGRVLSGLNRFVDGGDRGDEYTFCAPARDRIVDSPVSAPDTTVKADGIGQEMVVQMTFAIPASLADGDRSSRSTHLVPLDISTRVTLTPGVRRVVIETTVVNQASDHRLRVHFPAPCSGNRSWAEGHFDVVERISGVANYLEGWAEQPVGTHPQLAFVDVSDGQQGLLVANQGLPEYELIPAAAPGQDSTLALTLLRCVGWLSRGDLPNRAGPAGPAIETPGAQCHGRYTFHYALVPHAGNYLTAQHEAHALSAPLRAAAVLGDVPRSPEPPGPGRLPPSGSLVRVSPAAVVLTALKPPQQGGGMVLRVYNSASIPVLARVAFWRPFGQIRLVRLDEREDLGLLASDASEVLISLRAKEIATLHIVPL